MIKSGLKPILYDRRDYDFHKSFGSIAPPIFPESYNVDLAEWVPDQTAAGLPFGCTSFTQTDLVNDEDGTLHDVMLLENVTHSNAKGGLDIRVALDATKKIFNRTAYFNIKPSQGMDMFDSIRLAMLYTREEKRSVSVGTPWFPEFATPLKYGVLPMPINLDTSRASWHNWKICGWEVINGKTYLIGKSWQGKGYGDGGFHRISRELCNALFNIRYTAAYTVTKRPANATLPINFDIIGWIITWFKTLVPNG